MTCWAMCLGLWAAAPPKFAADETGYAKTAAPFLAKYCVGCHGAEQPKGEFSVLAAKLPNDFADRAARGKWREVVDALQSHEMPPKKAPKQPTPAEVAAVADWIVAEAVRAEKHTRGGGVVLRRLNRNEYRNALRDLLGVEVDVSGFPADPLAGGFDNNGAALTASAMQLELYLDAARQALERALVEGARPRTVKWRFTPRVGGMDRTRVKLDDDNRSAIVNGGKNLQKGDWVMLHHDSWDKHVNARNFKAPSAGDYAIRVKAAGRVPDRAEVVAAAEKLLAHRRDEQDRKNPKGKRWTQPQYERDLEHFRTDRMYDYGPPRIKLSLQLGPQPRTVAEFDADGTLASPKVHEFRTRFTTESAGVSFEYAYALPKVLENFWMQGNDAFARPELYIEWFEIEGPLHEPWPPASHAGLLEGAPKPGQDERGAAEDILARFLRRAYRRPVQPAEVAAKLAHFDAARTEGATFVAGLRRALTAALVSPHFLYVAEPAGADGAPRKLDGHELATRLALLAWSSIPDAELRAAADAGKLAEHAERVKQLERMLADPKADAFVKNFAGQWLGLREVGNNPPAPDLFPQYDRHLETSIVKESEEFFRTILREDLDARNFLKSDFVMANERLARFYGLPGVRGDHFRKVPAPALGVRGGLVTQASVLTITSNGTRTTPVKRGTWILRNLLDADPGLPLANVGEIAPKVPGIDKATVRKRLEIHRSLEQCARCHNKIDPLGFALENYNAAGEWREREGFGYKGRVERNDPPIDASSALPDGTKVVGVVGLQTALLAREDQFLRCLAAKLLTYALGRELGLADQPTVQAAVKHMQANGRTVKSLLRFVACCEPFETK